MTDTEQFFKNARDTVYHYNRAREVLFDDFFISSFKIKKSEIKVVDITLNIYKSITSIKYQIKGINNIFYQLKISPENITHTQL